jgi:hypothetical protein
VKGKGLSFRKEEFYSRGEERKRVEVMGNIRQR